MNTALPVRHRAFIAILLVLALLSAQWAGMAHRVEHASLVKSFASLSANEHDSDSKHSCIAFDAATVADTVSVPQFVAPLLAGVQVLALWAAFRSWDAPLALHFSSRAPPLA